MSYRNLLAGPVSFLASLCTHRTMIISNPLPCQNGRKVLYIPRSGAYGQILEFKKDPTIDRENEYEEFTGMYACSRTPATCL